MAHRQNGTAASSAAFGAVVAAGTVTATNGWAGAWWAVAAVVMCRVAKVHNHRHHLPVALTVGTWAYLLGFTALAGAIVADGFAPPGAGLVATCGAVALWTATAITSAIETVVAHLRTESIGTTPDVAEPAVNIATVAEELASEGVGVNVTRAVAGEAGSPSSNWSPRPYLSGSSSPCHPSDAGPPRQRDA